MSNFAYFKIITPGVKDERFVRMKSERFDDEWKEMCREQGRTFPFVIFDKTTFTECMAAVLLKRLRPTSDAVALELDDVWYHAVEGAPQRMRPQENG